MKYMHHQKGVQYITTLLQQDPEVLAVLVGGSIAHRREREDSDIDLMIMVSDADFHRRTEQLKTWYLQRIEIDGREIVVDGKYISESYIQLVKEQGNEPTKYALQDAIVTYSSTDGLEDQLHSACAYPIERKQDNINRFFAQFMGWHWYCDQAIRRDDAYVLTMAVGKMLLFAGRMILADNEILYPYHKWLLKALQDAPDKPEGLMESIDKMLDQPTQDHITAFFELVKEHKEWKTDTVAWPNTVARDNELVWMEREPHVDDI